MGQQLDILTRDYLTKQVARTLATIESIRSRGRVHEGRVIPDGTDIAIHAGRRLTATVMFLDISKFSSRPSSTPEEQETLLQILSLFFTEMIRIIEDYGGVVEKNTGDGLMAYFVAEPADQIAVQQRALTAALTMFYASSNIINPVLQNSSMQVLDFRICMDHGPITVAKVGAARGFNGIVAIGATANIASKMLSFAGPNTILLGSMVLDGLPVEWKRQFVRLETSETGWTYTSNGQPYAFWRYDGRWKDPAL